MMRVRGPILPGVEAVGRRVAVISPGAKRRLAWIDWHRSHGENARRTCRHFSISPDTFYRRLRRYDPNHLLALEDRSRRPGRLRQPTWSAPLEDKVLELREQHPRWGKDKLAVLLRRDGCQVSTSMVGRILARLKKRGMLREPLPNGISARRRLQPRPYAQRKPREYRPQEPGDLVELDTLDVRPLPGVILKHFTARDVVSRYDVVAVHRQAKASTTAHFLDVLQSTMPFTIRAIQVDGGSEFQSVFEEECRKRSIHLFVLPPRSPKLNGPVERAQRTHTEEFYEVYDGDFEIAPLSKALKQWQQLYNHIRPHQALGYLTPAEFLAGRVHQSQATVVSSTASPVVPDTIHNERRKVYGIY